MNEVMHDFGLHFEHNEQSLRIVEHFEKMIVGKIRKWGNSMGILISKKDVEKLGFHEGQDVQVKLESKSNPLKEMFGQFPNPKPTEEILKELRKNTSKFE